MKTSTLAAGAVALAIGALGAIQPASASAGSISGLVAPAHFAGQVTKVTYGYNNRVPLPRVFWNLKQKGFSNFRNVKWLPWAYVITANGYRGYPVRVTVNAYNGHIASVDRIGPPSFYYGGYGGSKGYGWKY
jgi:hypothetical protein